MIGFYIDGNDNEEQFVSSWLSNVNCPMKRIAYRGPVEAWTWHSLTSTFEAIVRKLFINENHHDVQELQTIFEQTISGILNNMLEGYTHKSHRSLKYHVRKNMKLWNGFTFFRNLFPFLLFTFLIYLLRSLLDYM